MSPVDIKCAALMLLSTAFLLEHAKAKSITFVSTNVSFNPIYYSAYKMAIINGSLDLKINVAQNYTRDMWAVVDIALKDRDIYSTRLQYDFNVCGLLGKGRSKIITDIIHSIVKQGNFPAQCPILKGNYSWHLNPQMFKIPPFVIPCQLRLRYSNYFRQRSGRDSIANTTVFFKVNN